MMFDVCCFNTNLLSVSRIRVALLMRGICHARLLSGVHTKGKKIKYDVM